MKPLAIIGLGRGWSNAPWSKKGWERWSLNAGWQKFDGEQSAACTAWFELHSRRYLLQEWGGEKRHFTALSILRCPVYVQHPKQWPGHDVRQFPSTKLRRHFGTEYHASSLDWMLAFALYSGYKDIHFWGVNFGPTEGGEPMSARACLEYWIGRAHGMGVKVTVHEPTGLFWIYNFTRHKTPYHFDDTWRLVEDRE